MLMDIVEMPFMRYPAMPEVAQLYAILAKYAVFGIAPIVIPPIFPDIPIPTSRIPTHKGEEETSTAERTWLTSSSTRRTAVTFSMWSRRPRRG